MENNDVNNRFISTTVLKNICLDTNNCARNDYPYGTLMVFRGKGLKCTLYSHSLLQLPGRALRLGNVVLPGKRRKS